MSYSNELKQEVVELHLKNHSTITELSDAYNLAPSTVFTWIKNYEKDHGIFKRDEKKIRAKNGNYYTQLDINILYEELLKKDIEIGRLKNTIRWREVVTKKE